MKLTDSAKAWRFAAGIAVALACAPIARAQGSCGTLRQAEAALARSGIAIDVRSVEAFYDSAGGPCLWDDASADALMSSVSLAGDDGLDPSLFHAEDFGGQGPSGLDAGARDVLLTDAAIKYAVALTRGLSAGPELREDRAADAKPNGEIVEALKRALSENQVETWLLSLPPRAPAYDRLKAALSTYRAIAEAGGWKEMPADLRLRPKKKSPLATTLKERLALEGDLTFDDGAPVYDDAAREAVRRFQERNSLLADGKLNGKTIERLNVSAAERVAQISLNMERWRVYGPNLPTTRVEVNAPDATAVLYRDGVAVLKMNAVVGAPGHDTPTLTSNITTVVVNPPWNVPNSIVQNEIKPLLKRNKNYLEENHMYWSGDQLIQEPGPHNALGRIKFEFPNRFSVYLHDTPARKLFTDPERAQSHGCVRLERPLDLALELLQGDETWDRAAIEEAIREGDTKRIALSEQMPVVITYQTVFMGEDGLVQFRPDIYGLDTQLTLVLSQRVAAMRSEPRQW